MSHSLSWLWLRSIFSSFLLSSNTLFGKVLILLFVILSVLRLASSEKTLSGRLDILLSMSWSEARLARPWNTETGRVWFGKAEEW